MMERWQGKVALVTGATSGIGRAVALDLAAAGMQVVAWGRRQARLDELASESEALAGSIRGRAVDLREEADILAGFAEAREALGGVDVLINNAGLGYETSLSDGETEKWREMLEVNVLALCICTREVVMDTERRGVDGHIVHVSSLSAHRVPPGSGVYSATKYAVRSLAEGLRKELREKKSGTRISQVSPGYVETEFHRTFTGSEERAKETYSKFRVLDADDVAGAVRMPSRTPRGSARERGSSLRSRACVPSSAATRPRTSSVFPRRGGSSRRRPHRPRLRGRRRPRAGR
jgi:NADP-dependent 3-hydroxy acid dehydrogenase YdfG